MPNTVFSLYLNTNRPNLQAELSSTNSLTSNHQTNFGKMSSLASAKFKSLPPESLALYTKAYGDAKALYDEQIKSYTPPPGYDSSGKSIKDKKEAARRKRRKDPLYPKNPVNQFPLFVKKTKVEFKLKFPQGKLGDLSKYASEKYSKLAPAELEELKVVVEEDARMFAREVADYKPGEGYDLKGFEIEKEKEKEQEQEQEQDKKPKQPMNAFMHFANEGVERGRLKELELNVSISLPEMSKKLSESWNALKTQEKKKYTDLAAAGSKQYKIDLASWRKKQPPPLPKKEKKKAKPPLATYPRKSRCTVCSSCKAANCGKCDPCKSMVAFGGKGTLKQSCEKRRCKNSRKRRSRPSHTLFHKENDLTATNMGFVAVSGSGIGSGSDSESDSSECSSDNGSGGWI